MTETFDFAFKPLVAGRRRPRLHHALRLRRADSAWGEIGRYQPDYPGQADRAQRRGDHLPRPHEQPRQRDSTSTTAPGPIFEREHDGTLVPRRAGRARRASCSTTCTPPAASPRSTTPRSSPRRCPFFAAVLPRLPVGLHGRGDRLLEGRRDRGVDRAAAADEPVHASSAIAFYERALDPGRQDRGGRRRATRTTPAADGRVPQPAGADRHADHRRVRRRALRGAASSRAVKAGHTYVKLTRQHGARTCGSPPGPAQAAVRAMIGDTVRGNEADFIARVLDGSRRVRGSPGRRRWCSQGRGAVADRDRRRATTSRCPSPRRARPLPAAAPARRGEIEVVSSPIWFEPLPPRPGRAVATPTTRTRGRASASSRVAGGDAA